MCEVKWWLLFVLNLLPFELSDFANLFDSGINSTRINVEERMKVNNMNLPIPWDKLKYRWLFCVKFFTNLARYNPST